MINPLVTSARESDSGGLPCTPSGVVVGSGVLKIGWAMVSFGPTGVQSTLIAGALKNRIINTAKTIK